MKSLSSLASQVRANLEPLAAINSDASAEHDNWPYRRMYVQPTYRLGETLLTSRELLLVVTDFVNVQARHITMVERELGRASGRLEPGMAIVVHQDPDGNSKLRDWGRERGLTVLPVCGSPAVPRGDALEQALCEGIYSHDPFDLTGPVRSVHQFFGRPDVPDVARRLRTGHIQALFGIRKIGKTSVLNRIQAESMSVHAMACVMADLSDDSLSGLDAGALLSSIADATERALESEESYARVVPVATVTSAAESASRLIQLTDSANRPILLTLDEIDYIAPSSPLAPHWRGEFNIFFRALRQVYQECARRSRPFSVMLCGVSSHWFAVEEIDGVENAALAFVPETYLPPLERRQSVHMIQAVGRSAGLIFDDESANALAATASDIPFWVRRAGSYVNSCFELENRPFSLEEEAVSTLCAEFVEVEGAQLAFSSLRHLFRIYPQLGVTAVDVMNGRRVERVPQPLLSALGRYGIIGNGVEPSGPMMEAGLRQWETEHYKDTPELPLQFKEEPVRSAVEAGSISAAGEEEWASLLSEVSVRRNVCERDLRDLVLTIIRVELANRDDGRTPADVLIGAVQHERREHVRSSSARAVARSLLWSELINVIKRNWSWFESIFVDRKQLELWADIVNDRPDAHAKDFDGADLALQRRAIEWIHGRVQAAGVI